MYNVQFPLITGLNGGCPAPASIPVSSCASLLNVLPHEEDSKRFFGWLKERQRSWAYSSGLSGFSVLQESIKDLWPHYSASASFNKITPGMDLIFHLLDEVKERD